MTSIAEESLFTQFDKATPNVNGTCKEDYEKFQGLVNTDTKKDLANILDLFDEYGLLKKNKHTKN